MKSVPTLARTAALAAGALILASAFGAAPAQAAVTADQCKAADALADGVYEMALKSPRLYPTPADAAAAAKAAFTRQVLGNHNGYNGDGRGPAEQHRAQSLCRSLGAAGSGPWV